MGLDIYLYRVSRPTDYDLSKPVPDLLLKDNPFVYSFSKDDLKNKKMYAKTLINNGVWADVLFCYFERGIFLKDHGYKEDYYVCMSEKMVGKDYKKEDIIYFDVYDGNVKYGEEPILIVENIEVKNDIFMERYYTEEIERRLLIELTEITYQRKHINDKGWELMPENCSFYDNKNIIMRMCEMGGLDDDFIRLWVDGETVFHPWW